MWIEDPNWPSGWRYEPTEPRAEATYLLPAYTTPNRHVLREDTSVSQSNSGQGDGLVSYDPNDPHDPNQADVDPLGHGPDPFDPTPPNVAVCPTCGTAVARDRLR